jgi:hypothetical protein
LNQIRPVRGYGKRGYDLRIALQQRLDTLQSAVR